ncbi:MAG: pilus assembly protein [Collimonas sp.]|uniref:Flp family type IVb pilin n=1 Tax=Collimonas sp. TaxID=1963772 RepID=UPI0032671A27
MAQRLTSQLLRNKTALRQRGQGMSEYIIIVALIAVVSIGVFAAFGSTIRHQVAGMAQELSGNDSKAEIANAKTSADLATKNAATQRTMKDYGADNR